MQLHCTIGILLCILFFESLLHDIDLCQLEATARQFQIGWCSPIFRGMNVSWLLLATWLFELLADNFIEILLFILFIYKLSSYTKNIAEGFIEHN